jgi:hypothetical protein
MARRASAAEIAGWFRRWPRSNVAIVTGTISDVVVLDVDPRHGGEASLERLEAELGPLPETVQSATGGGGRHIWFSLGGGAAPPSSVLAPGLDLKSEGGLVIAPPSLHASGTRYAWRPNLGPDEHALAPVPPALLSRTLARPVGPHPRGIVVPRTVQEQRAFAEAWQREGIALADGDAYYRCPFHPDDHPSLHIDPVGCRWYCFGCHRGGGPGALRALFGEGAPRPATRSRVRGTVGPRVTVSLAGDTWIDAVGESHHQDELLALAGRRSYGGVDLEAVAELVPEPAHPIDPQAVSVWIGGRPVGYLGRADARRLRRDVDAARAAHGHARCHARIRGGWDRGRGDLGSFGVQLLLPSGVATTGRDDGPGETGHPDRDSPWAANLPWSRQSDREATAARSPEATPCSSSSADSSSACATRSSSCGPRARSAPPSSPPPCRGWDRPTSRPSCQPTPSRCGRRRSLPRRSPMRRPAEAPPSPSPGRVA